MPPSAFQVSPAWYVPLSIAEDVTVTVQTKRVDAAHQVTHIRLRKRHKGPLCVALGRSVYPAIAPH